MGCSDSNIHKKEKVFEFKNHPPKCSWILSIVGQPSPWEPGHLWSSDTKTGSVPTFIPRATRHKQIHGSLGFLSLKLLLNTLDTLNTLLKPFQVVDAVGLFLEPRNS